MMNRAIKYRLYPTTEQAVMFAKTFGCCRKVYNLMLADKVQSYKETGAFASVTPAMYKKDYPYLKEVDSLALCNVQQNLQSAFRNCFDRSRKKTNGFPKFKSAKHSRKSYTTNNQHGTIALADNHIKLPKTGFVKTVIHRKPEPDWILKSATVSMDSDGRYFCSVLFAIPDTIPQIPLSKDRVLGLDYATSCLYVDSNGESADMPKWYKRSADKLAKEQRKLSRKTGSRKNETKSANWYKQQKKVARIHSKIRNQRKDFLHKRSTAITKQYDVIGIEDLSIREQLQSRKYKNFRKSTLDNGWYLFTEMLAYKEKAKGGLVVKVDRAYPSTKRCHVCGHVNLSIQDDTIRKWICPVCGTAHNRDENSACNIRDEAIRIVFC